METWLTLDRVVFLSGWSKRHIRRLASANRIQTRDKRALCIPGKPAQEYALSSLPVEAQLKFLRQPLLAGPDCTALALRSNLNQSKLFASLPEVTEPERLSFSARQNAQALRRLEAIAPLVEFSSRSRGSRPTFRTVGGAAVRSMNSMAGYLADQHHLSPRTLWNWYAR